EIAGIESARERAAADRAMLRRVQRIRMDRGPGLDARAYDDALLAAFSDYGIDLEGGDSEAAVSKLRESGIRRELVSMLDEWALERRTNDRLADRELEPLLGLARAVDDDPWRGRIRDCIRRGSLEGLRRVVADVDEGAHPAASLDLAARLLMNQGANGSAANLLRRALDLHPGDYWLNLHLSECCRRIRMRDLRETRDDALRFALAARAIQPESPWAWAQVATAMEAAGAAPEEVEPVVQRALELEPEYAGARNLLAVFVLGPTGRREEAISHLEAAVRIAPGEPMHPCNLAIDLHEAGRVGEALEVLEKALLRFPDHRSLLNALATCIEARDGAAAARPAFERAADAYEEWLEDHPESWADWERLMFLTGRRAPVPDPVRNEKAVRNLVRIAPENPFYRYNLARLHEEKGDVEEALAETATALGHAPRDERRTGLLKLRSRLLLTLRRYEEAVFAIRRAVELEPDDPFARWNLGVDLCYDGRLEEGVAELARARELGLSLPPHLVEFQASLEKMRALVPDLERIAAGEREPADAEEVELFADFLWVSRRDLGAARLFRRLLREAPERRAENRYNAAACAAVAGDEELSPLDAPERAEWRRWALTLLREELEARRTGLADPEVRAQTRGEIVAWFHARQWSGYRTEKARLRLPEGEREAWRILWAEVRAAIE
ncbi:MAG: tetratricopeptide repeat protein, partial [Candidatus Latescibacteria bacterium]|nr:tetratricopeptide repeat protein [Candidatus Latescibacterota bacterium]